MIVKGRCTHCGMNVGSEQFKTHGGVHDSQRIEAQPEHVIQIQEDIKEGMVPAADTRAAMAPADHAEITVLATAVARAELIAREQPAPVAEGEAIATGGPVVVDPAPEAPASSEAGQ